MQKCYHLEWTQKQCHGMRAKESAKANQYNIYLYNKPRQKCRSVITWKGHKSNVMECRQRRVQKPTNITSTFTANQERNAGVLSLGMDTKAMSWNAGKV